MSEDKKRGLLGRIGDVFAPEVGDEVDPKDLPPVASLPARSAVAFPSSVTVDPARAKQLDDAATAQLSSAMEKVAGSYADLTTDMDVLVEAVPDEGLRLKAAMKMLSKKGITMAKLLGDVDACLGALEAENRTFKAATQDQIDQKVGSKRKAVEQTKASMSAKQAQIVAIQADLVALGEQLSATAADVKAEEDNITVVQDRFSYVFTNMRASLTAQRARIAAQGT